MHCNCCGANPSALQAAYVQALQADMPMVTAAAILAVQQGPSSVWVATAVAITTGDDTLADLVSARIQVGAGWQLGATNGCMRPWASMCPATWAACRLGFLAAMHVLAAELQGVLS